MHHTEVSSVTHPLLSKITHHIISLGLIVVLACIVGCGQSKGLGTTEYPTPEAEPCGDGCEEGFSCVPGLDENGDPGFLCVNVHIRYCAPCMEDADCVDPLMPDAQSVCLGSENGQGSFCATDCAEHTDCPDGAYCGTIDGGRSVCLAEAGECECSTWAIENAGVTQCATSNIHGSCAGIRECTEDGLTQCDADLPAAETCNGIDDNCDGIADETFPEQGEACDGEDTDLCTDGATACEDGALICIDDPMGFAEDCNGIDDDCDGIEDNNLPSITADLVEGVCAGMEKVCNGVDGWAEPDYSQVPPYEVEEATCDGLDNDCDGQADEDYVAGGSVTYTDLNGDVNLVKGNACGVGACVGGTVVCAEDGISLTCSTVGNVGEEICDGIDNDCDGEVDEGFNAPLADKQDGVCVGATKVCGAGDGWVEPDYTLIENYEEQEISCDNLDNDCDGEEDELYIEGGLINFADVDGSTLVKNETCGFGACSGGVVICAEDKISLICDSAELATEEVCDGVDNDCNMSADDGLTPPESDNQQGVCVDNFKVCGGEEGWLEPDYAANAGFEALEASCDDIDNDCNGEVDENYGANGTVTFTDTNGTTDLVKGDGCGTGACYGGTVVCGNDLLSLACSTADQISPEVCDGVDNDCNGEVDEGFNAPLADLQLGVCAGQTKVCGAGDGWVEPDYSLIENYEAEEISCDGIDNDCDGEIDELYVAGGPLAYTDLDGTSGLGKGDNCGVGMCSGGTVVCSEDGLSLTCNTASIAEAETCDGEDNNCDGSTDNELTSPDSDLQTGVCAGSVKLCAGASGWVEPNYTELAGYETSEASCDGIDNDCDGFADNNLTAPNADNQNGACGGAIKVCGGMNGWQEPNYAVMDGYEATETSCDGVDNDCNGTADDGLTPPVATLQAGACENAVQVCTGAAGWTDPDYTLIAGYEASEVSCDGVDNDCDGGVDNGLNAPNADNQNGICLSSTKVCSGNGGWVEPDYSAIGGFEADEFSCDGKDNDCDGQIDEALTAPAATKQNGVCVGAVKVCGASAGWIEPDYTAISGYEVEEVSCDDIDNDCDGTADELFLITGVVTYTDLNGTPGLSKGQDCGVGSCSGGTVVCAPSGSNLTCSTNDQVAAESCDGADNDCDGNTDENLSPPVSDNQSGVCSGTVKVCGGASGWQEPDYTSLTNYEVSEVTCDGLDNNCDGTADNGLTAPNATNQNGICSGATQVCNGAAGWVEPDYSALTGYEDTETICDGNDNDCDGQVDEELNAPNADTQTGVCAGALKICSGEAGWVEPDYTTVSQYETNEASCDGQDNDCDGNIDEDLTAPNANNQNGACSGATKFCGGVSGWLEPDYSLMTNFEALEVTCDGVDNDCDGTADNGLNAPNANSQAGVCDGVKKVCGGTTGWQEPDYTSTTNFEANEASCDGLDNDCDGNVDEDLSAPLSAKQDGVCENALKVCGGSSGWQEPDYTAIENYEAEESRCDNRDNDCDGDTDEQFAAGGLVTYTDLNGTANLVKGQSCGAGACTGGTVVCGDNETTLTCSTLDQVAVESCDGNDNDCDGSTDESLTAPASDLQSGVCVGSIKVCGGTSGWLEPNYGTIANYEVTETSCDGVDNDCDGLSDENANPPAADKQAGVCAGQLKVCNGSGGWAEPDYSSIANYEATEISCDSIDNDCDGTADELYILGGSITYTDLNGTTGLVKGNNCGAGVCAGGTVVCGSDALSLSCNTSGNAGSDICDGNDNDCDGTADEDFNLNTDTDNCGTCGTTCDYTNGVPACNAGSCELSGCDSGYGNCDSNDSNGCEVDVTSSEDHCGSCGDVCDPSNASGQCSDGSCDIVSCNSGYEDCNASVTDGCEVNTQTDEANCGSCGDVCDPNNATGVCSSGTCTVGSCDSPYSDCNGSPVDGCEVSLATSITNCGACGVTCTNSHGSTACSGGTCAPSCDALWGSCDGNVNNGCETALTSLTNCGSCGSVCSLANAAESCSTGTCTLTSCNSGYANCDSVDSNGCEANLNTNTSNCGACGNSCTNDHGSTTCSAGTCVPTCDAGWSDCDGDPTNGCETNLNTLTDCGSCGNVCSLANGSESCAGGSCVLTACDSGYSSCNGIDADGCEVDIFNDTSNCGTCGTTCTNDHGSMVCSSGSCAPSCASGYDNCDGNVNNGCETALNSLSNCGACGVSCSLDNASESCSSGVCELSACDNKYCNANNVTGDGCEFDLDTDPGCSGGVTNLGEVNGDVNGNTITISGTGEQWYRVYVDEDSSLAYDMGVKVSLSPASGTDYDLTVHKGSCSGTSQSSSASGSTTDSVQFNWNDCWGFWCDDDGAWMYIQVKAFSANVCSSFTLSVQGDP